MTNYTTFSNSNVKRTQGSLPNLAASRSVRVGKKWKKKEEECIKHGSDLILDHVYGLVGPVFR